MDSGRIEIPKDILWKSLLEDIFPEFLKYFISQADDIFDFSLGVSFLDKELEQLFPEGNTSNHRADKLAKVYLKNGIEQWILVHVEVQGYEDETFPERMFQYFYRIRDRYSQSVMAFAILTDANKRYRPKEYRYKFFETEVIYSYHFLKLTDYKPIDFQPNNNLFAIALEVAWHGLQKKSLDDTKLYKLKFDLCRRVLNRGYTFQDFVKLFNFIKFYVSFGNQELFAKFEEEIRTETNQPQSNMGIVEAVEVYIKQKAEEIGLERGMQKGMEEGELKKAKIAIPKLFMRGMSIEDIAETLEVSSKFVRATLKASKQN
ncbi:hypothetical protein [Runella sp.]|jgi:predicted transposase YdaD|uniref:hypothetical protein n=1 Tax=Runella sp. TaxID=1960881 RepID=UPI002614B4DD|nr:hypothetical protein [Runella sp.]